MLVVHEYWVCDDRCGAELRITAMTAWGYAEAIKDRKRAGWRMKGDRLLCPACLNR